MRRREPSLYEVLQVSTDASEAQIRKAYRRLQMKYHPDRNHNSDESKRRTQSINLAYETLNDPVRKKQYDRSLPTAAVHAHHNEATTSHEVDFQTALPSTAEDPLAMALKKPLPIIDQVEISMSQVFLGATIPYEVQRWTMESGVKTMEKETIYVNIAPGTDEGEILVLREKGNILANGEQGDVKLCVKIRNETAFQREGLNLLLTRRISLKEALCGFSCEITHLNGKTYVVSNQSGTIVRPGFRKVYPDMGLRRDGHVGQFILQFEVEFPAQLPPEVVQQLATLLPA